MSDDDDDDLGGNDTTNVRKLKAQLKQVKNDAKLELHQTLDKMDKAHHI